MGAERDLFRQVGWTVHGNPNAYETLCRAAELWRAEGQPFSAGMAMLRAVDAAWGRPEIMLNAQHAALRDFERVVVEQPPDTPAALAALRKLLQTLGSVAVRRGGSRHSSLPDTGARVRTSSEAAHAL